MGFLKSRFDCSSKTIQPERNLKTEKNHLLAKALVYWVWHLVTIVLLRWGAYRGLGCSRRGKIGNTGRSKPKWRPGVSGMVLRVRVALRSLSPFHVELICTGLSWVLKYLQIKKKRQIKHRVFNHLGTCLPSRTEMRLH